MFLRIALIFALLGTLASSLNTRSHIDVVDETIDWGYKGQTRTWSGKVEQTFSYRVKTNICRKYTIQKSTPDNQYYTEIGINHECQCWFTCINKDTPIFPGDSVELIKKANGKWCYGQNVKKKVHDNLGKQGNPYGHPLVHWDSDMSKEQARNVISDFCAQATRCKGTCS